MERLTQALAVNEIKYIRHRETTSHLYLFLSLLAQARKLNRAGLKGTFHRPGVHLCSPRPSSSVRHVQRETEPSQRQQIPKNFSFGPTLLKWKVLARKSPSCICKGTPRSSFVQMTPGLRASGFGYICMGRGGPAVPKRPLGTTLQWLQRGGGAGWSPVHLASHGGAVGSKPMKLTFCRLILELWGTGEDSALGLPPMAGRGGRSFLLLHAGSFKARATDRRGWHVGEVSPARSRAHVQHMAASAVM